MLRHQLIECVPNFSEGRSITKVNAIADALSSVPLVHLLHVDRGYDANRTVYTLVGPPSAIVDALVKGFDTALQLCDMSEHHGTHPRIGLLDVCPFIPLQHITFEETQAYVLQLAERLAGMHRQTIYLYEKSATRPERTNLATIRKGEYEGLESKLKQTEWLPDYGSAAFLPRTGASVIGVRPLLIAYNINLNVKNVKIAKAIAKRVRTSGYISMSKIGGMRSRVPGLLPGLKAIGWYVEEYQCAQISMNIVDFSIVGMHEIYETCRGLAEEYGAELNGSELIGLVPKAAMIAAGEYYANRAHIMDKSERQLVHLAIEHLGLSSLSPFVAQDRIIEYLIKA